LALKGIKVIGEASNINKAAADAELSKAFQQGVSNIAVSAALGASGIPGLNINRLDLSSGGNLAQSVVSAVTTVAPSVPGTGTSLTGP
jgi:hypothetical protein